MIYETNCLIFLENDIWMLKSVLGERFWNDTENIRCVPTRCVTDEECLEFDKLAGRPLNIRKAQFLIAEMDYGLRI